MKRICTVYRSPRREGMYLLVDRSEGLARVPEALLERFGTPQESMTLVLTPERRLARADTAEVLQAIGERGYYLQMPPLPDREMVAIAAANDKLEQR